MNRTCRGISIRCETFSENTCQKCTQVAGQTFVEMDGVEPRFFVPCYEEGVNCHITVS